MFGIKKSSDLFEELPPAHTYCIRNKRSGEFVNGTDYRYHPPRQFTDSNQARTYPSRKLAEMSFEQRRCSDDYEIVEVKLVVVEGEEKDE